MILRQFGGDEFALILPETGADPANLVAQRMGDALANDGGSPKLSVSVGVAIHPKHGESIDALLIAADKAMYAMKNPKPDVFSDGGNPS